MLQPQTSQKLPGILPDTSGAAVRISICINTRARDDQQITFSKSFCFGNASFGRWPCVEEGGGGREGGREDHRKVEGGEGRVRDEGEGKWLFTCPFAK